MNPRRMIGTSLRESHLTAACKGPLPPGLLNDFAPSTEHGHTPEWPAYKTLTFSPAALAELDSVARAHSLGNLVASRATGRRIRSLKGNHRCIASAEK